MAPTVSSDDKARVKRHNDLQRLVDNILEEDRVINDLSTVDQDSQIFKTAALERIKTRETAIVELLRPVIIDPKKKKTEPDFLRRARVAAQSCPSLGVKGPTDSIPVRPQDESLYFAYAKAHGVRDWIDDCEYLVAKGEAKPSSGRTVTWYLTEAVRSIRAHCTGTVGSPQNIDAPAIGLYAYTIKVDAGVIEVWVERRVRPIIYG